MRNTHPYCFCTVSKPATRVKRVNSFVDQGRGRENQRENQTKKTPILFRQTLITVTNKSQSRKGKTKQKIKKNNLKACITISTEENTDEKEKGVNTTKRWKRGPQIADESKINTYALHTIEMLLLHQIVTDTFSYRSPVYCLLNKFTHKWYTTCPNIFFFLKHAFNAG